MSFQILLDLFEGQSGPIVSERDPPASIRLFRKGVNSTRKGQFLFDEQAAESVLAKSAEWGVDHSIDYDHAMIMGGFFDSMDPAERGKAAGWFQLAVQDGELHAVEIKWTPRAAKAISQGEWRYVSPAFNTNDSGRITEIINLAITNIPATDHPDPLRALSRSADSGHSSNEVGMKSLLIALGLKEDSSEADAIAKVLAMSSSIAQVEMLTAEVKVLKAEKAKTETEKLAAEIEVAVKDGRVPPVQREVMLNLGATSPEIVRQLLASAPKRVAMEDAPVAPPSATPGSAVMLSDTDKQACKLLAISHEEFLATKKRLAEKAVS